MYIIKIAFLK